MVRTLGMSNRKLIAPKVVETNFKWTQKQLEALKLLSNPNLNEIYLYGGARAAKTFLLVAVVLFRALKAPGSRHAIIRSVFKDVKNTIGFETLEDVKKLIFTPNGILAELNKQDWIINLPQVGSRVWLTGVDDNARMEQVLGLGLNTVFLNEASQMTYRVLEIVKTRLAEKNTLVNKLFIDANPPPTYHWLYKKYVFHINPTDKTPQDMASVASLLMNPTDNLENLEAKYLDEMKKLSKSYQARYLFGQYAATLDGAVYSSELMAADMEGRFGHVGINPDLPVFAAFDIGFSDATSIWVAQFDKDNIYLLEYLEDNRKPMTYYLDWLFNSYDVRTVYLPFDAKNRSWSTGKSIREVAEAECAKRGAYVRILPKLALNDGINVTRLLLPRCKFDLKRCSFGVEALQNYKYEFSEHLGRNKDEPLHDWASHGADAFRYICMAYGRLDEQQKPKEKPKAEPLKPYKLTGRELLRAAGIEV